MPRTLANAWKVPELRQRLMITAALIAALRLGAYVPLPGVSREGIAMGRMIFAYLSFGFWVNSVTGPGSSQSTHMVCKP
jgi:preprotein translocase subunit SecY